jgi:hypothetical protein
MAHPVAFGEAVEAEPIDAVAPDVTAPRAA